MVAQSDNTILRNIFNWIKSFPLKRQLPEELTVGGYLKVYNYATGTGGGGEQHTDGEAVNAADLGNLVLGTDGANYQLLHTDASGNLQVDVLSGAGGEQFPDGDAVDPADLGNLVLGTDGSNYQIIHTDAQGDVQVDVLSSALPTGAATSALQTTGNNYLNTIAGDTTSIDSNLIHCDTDNIAGTVAVSNPSEQHADGDAIVGGELGNIILGMSHSTFEMVAVDPDGHLQVDVLSTPNLDYTTDDVTVYGNQDVLQQNAVSKDLICTLDGEDVTVTPKAASTWDVSDRAARLVGIVYGSAGQLQQDGSTLLKTSNYNGANQTPAGDAAARKIYVQPTDGTDDLGIISEGDAVAKGINIYGGYEADTAVGTTTKGYIPRENKYKQLITLTPQSHYLLEGRKFSFSNELAVAGGSEIVCWLLSAGTRNVIVTDIVMTTHYATNQEAGEFRFYLQPTIKANGTGITEVNLYAGSGTANTASAYYTPTIAANGSKILEAWGREGETTKMQDSNGLFVLPASSGSLLVTVENNATMGTLEHCISIFWYETA